MSNAETNNSGQKHNNGRIANVLIVDDDPQLVRFMLEILARKGIRANLADNEKTAIAFLEKVPCDLVFTTENISKLPNTPRLGNAGFALLRRIKTNYPELPVVMIAESKKQDSSNHQKTVETAVNALRAGCCDFIIKPLEAKKIENLLDTFLPNHSISIIDSAEQDCRTLYRIVGKNAKLLRTINLAKRIAPTSAPVLISGESGTGKELISYLVHHKSKRANGPYIKVNCAALSDSLLESELFGHEKGAFTGAYAQRKGRFEMAHGGTLLLDEITETPAKFQAKLLRVLEQQDFERVGGNDNIQVNVRVISTTNKDLLQEVAQDRFRKDLYYRLSGVRLIVPPLIERTDDLGDLVWHFVNLHANEVQRHITELDPVMMQIFANYHWPGNVRQLRNVVLTSLILGAGKTLSIADVSWLFDELQPLPQQNNLTATNLQPSIEDLGGLPLVQIEQRAIIDTLRQTAGNQTKAAKVLGISDRTLRSKIKQYRQESVLQLT